MKKMILLVAAVGLLLTAQAQAQPGAGFAVSWRRIAAATLQPVNLADTVQVPDGQLRVGTSTTAGFVPIADARGILTLQNISAAGGGDITAVTAGDGLKGGGTTGAVTVDLNPKLAARTISITADSAHVTDNSISATQLANALDLGGETSLEIPNGAAPTVDAFGEIAGDNDLWAASRGAQIFYDGTAATALVNVLVSDAPSNGQVPTWNTGGTITWETPAAGGGISATQARATTGWTNQNGVITRDTVATRIEWGGIGGTQIVSFKIFDSDGDTFNISPQAGMVFGIKDGTELLFAVDSTGTPNNGITNNSTRFGFGSAAAAQGAAFGDFANASTQSSAFGNSANASNSSIANGVASSASGLQGGAFGNSAGNTIANAFTFKATQFFFGNAGNGESHSSQPSSIRFDVTKASGTNIAGAATFSIVGPLGTGNAASGDIPFFTGATGGSGTTLHTATEQMRIQNNNGGVDFGSASVNGLQTFIATDADQYTQSINTSDQALFAGASSYNFANGNVQAVTGLEVGGGTAIPAILTATATLDFPSTAAGTSSDLTITVTGADDGDAVFIGVPNGSTLANGDFSAWVSGANTVTVRFANNDLITARDPASGTFRAAVFDY